MLGQVKAGRLKALGVTTPKRWSELPEASKLMECTSRTETQHMESRGATLRAHSLPLNLELWQFDIADLAGGPPPVILRP